MIVPTCSRRNGIVPWSNHCHLQANLRDIDLSNCVSINDNDTSASAIINNDTSLNLSLNLENLDLNLSCLEDDGHDGDIDISKDQLQLLPKTVSELSATIREFAMDRNWSTYHTPRNIVLAMMGEMRELAEIFQWEGDCDCDSQLQLQLQLQLNGLNGVNSWPEDKKDHLEQRIGGCFDLLFEVGGCCWDSGFGAVGS